MSTLNVLTDTQQLNRASSGRMTQLGPAPSDRTTATTDLNATATAIFTGARDRLAQALHTVVDRAKSTLTSDEQHTGRMMPMADTIAPPLYADEIGGIETHRVAADSRHSMSRTQHRMLPMSDTIAPPLYADELADASFPPVPAAANKQRNLTRPLHRMMPMSDTIAPPLYADELAGVETGSLSAAADKPAAAQRARQPIAKRTAAGPVDYTHFGNLNSALRNTIINAKGEAPHHGKAPPPRTFGHALLEQQQIEAWEAQVRGVDHPVSKRDDELPDAGLINLAAPPSLRADSHFTPGAVQHPAVDASLEPVQRNAARGPVISLNVQAAEEASRVADRMTRELRQVREDSSSPMAAAETASLQQSADRLADHLSSMAVETREALHARLEAGQSNDDGQATAARRRVLQASHEHEKYGIAPDYVARP
jgi:hypothetical protein